MAEMSSSFINYQLTEKAGREGNDDPNVSKAICGKTMFERTEETVASSERSLTDKEAYRVDLGKRTEREGTAEIRP